jgi:hypothetical protein
VCQSLHQVVAAARSFVKRLEAEKLSGPELQTAYASFSELERLASAGKVLVAPRLRESADWRRNGERSAEEWMARTSGSTVAEARQVADTAEKLSGLEATAEKLRSGEISLDQAAAVAEGASVKPAAEAELLEMAATVPVRNLRDRARRIALEGRGSAEERYVRQVKLRSFSFWTDEEGMLAGRFRLTPDAGSAVVKAIGREADSRYRQAYREKRAERPENHAADAFVSLVTGDGRLGPRASKVTEVIVVVSHEALRRGFVAPESEELCEVVGFGAIPVSRARALLPDAFLKGVVADGTRITHVKHFGRHRPAEVDTALLTSAVLGKGRIECCVEGCGRSVGIEWDHAEPFAKGGPTSVSNLNPMCDYDNNLKERRMVVERNGRWLRLRRTPTAGSSARPPP